MLRCLSQAKVIAVIAAVCVTAGSVHALATAPEPETGITLVVAEAVTPTPVAAVPTQLVGRVIATVSPAVNATLTVEATQFAQYYRGAPIGPNFVGDLNGFTFRPSTSEAPTTCPNNNRPHTVSSEHESPLLASSNLDFQPTLIPNGFTSRIAKTVSVSGTSSGPVAVVQCGQTSESIISVSQIWTSPSGLLQIARRGTPPIIFGQVSKDRLEASRINGMPAVIISPRIPNEGVAIYLRDSKSMWTISAQGLSKDTALQIAAGLR